MAIVTCHRCVPSGESEPCPRVALRGERGRPEAVLRVAPFAVIRIRCRGELSTMRIGMAGRAHQLAGPVYGSTALGLVARRAAKSSVFTIQRERTSRMSRAIKQRRLKTGLIVTFATAGARRTRKELAVVRIRVAVRATGVRHRLVEIAVFVASCAGHLRVLPGQGKLGVVMVEAGTRMGVLPPAGVVARVATS